MSDKQWYKKWWIWGIVVVVMAMIGGAIEKKKPSETAPAEQSGVPTAAAPKEATKAGPEVAPQKTTPVVQQTQPVPQKVVAAPPKPLEWKTVVRVSARGKKQSDTFALRTAKQRLLYSLSGNENASMCWIYVIEEGKTLTGNGGVPAATVDKIGPGDTLMRRAPGNYYLEITAANCDCNVEIQELQ